MFNWTLQRLANKLNPKLLTIRAFFFSRIQTKFFNEFVDPDFMERNLSTRYFNLEEAFSLEIEEYFKFK